MAGRKAGGRGAGSDTLGAAVRISTFMTAAICGMLALAGGACSKLLGIEDPTAADGDGGIDGPPPTSMDRLELEFESVQIAKLQSVRVRVSLIKPDGMKQDATGSAIYESDNNPVATAPMKGRIDGGSQAGTATITARLGPAQPDTVTVTVADKMCHLVINELQAGGTGGPDDEWVEILNPCTTPVTVDNWTLVYRGGTTIGGTDSNTMFTLTGMIPSGELRLYVGNGFNGNGGTVTPDGTWTVANGYMGGTNGAVALRMGPQNTGPIADAVAYGVITAGHPFLEGLIAAPALTNGQSLQRQPFDGRDSDSAVEDFKQSTSTSPPSPRASNVK
jgi:hypothetical protein